MSIAIGDRMPSWRERLHMTASERQGEQQVSWTQADPRREARRIRHYRNLRTRRTGEMLRPAGTALRPRKPEQDHWQRVRSGRTSGPSPRYALGRGAIISVQRAA